MAGRYLKQLNLIKFFQDFEEDRDLTSYFEQLSKDITHLDYYKKASVKDQQKLLESYFFNALRKLTFLYADLNTANLDNHKLFKQSTDYVKAKFAPQEVVNLLDDAAQVVENPPVARLVVHVDALELARQQEGDNAQLVEKEPSCFFSLIHDFQFRNLMIASGLFGLSVAYIASAAALGMVVPLITALSAVVAVLSFSYCFLMVFVYFFEKNDASLMAAQPQSELARF